MLPLTMAACGHKQQKAQLPPLAPSEAANIPPPANAPPPPTETIPTKPTQEAPTPPVPAEQPVKKKKRTKPPADTTQQAANPSPEVSAIGQLSSGDPAEFLRQTQDSIASVEHGLKNINRTLDESEQKTADHIREFLKEAKAALASGDVDGAHTLADKARVLLNELTNK
jgi:outer membrane biosynthesis protein TonB